jgi:hypothetical protein
MKDSLKKDKMTLDQVLEYLGNRFHDMKDAGAGSLVYFMYGQVFQKKQIYKGLVTFVIGTMFAMYVAPQVVLWLNLNQNFAAFVLGLLGMRLTEALLYQDYREILRGIINSKTNSESHSDNSDTKSN